MTPTKTRMKVTAIAEQIVDVSYLDWPVTEVSVETGTLLVTGIASDEAKFCTVIASRPYIRGVNGQRALISPPVFASVNPKDGTWSADLGDLLPGKYLVSCCTDESGSEFVVFRLDVISSSLKTDVSITDQFPTGTRPNLKWTFKGNVSFSGDPVACSLAPITSTGKPDPTGTTYNQAATVTGTAWNVVFNNPNAHLYSFAAAETGDGTASEPINIT